METIKQMLKRYARLPKHTRSSIGNRAQMIEAIARLGDERELRGHISPLLRIAADRGEAFEVRATAVAELWPSRAPEHFAHERVGKSLARLAWDQDTDLGALAAVLSAATGWLAVHLQATPSSSQPAIACWNATARLCVLLLAAFATAALKRALVIARTDPLTGLPNTRAFHDAAEAEMARARRYGRPFTIACLDIDGFKSVNDRFGMP